MLGTAALLPWLLAAAPSLRPTLDPAVITRSLAQGAHAGECERCHTTHAKDQPILYPNALVGPDDNSLCEGCHTIPWQGGSYAGPSLYRGESHGVDPLMVWPGPDPPARVDLDAAGKCLNCHDPHGRADAMGPIPMLTVAREEGLCSTCHDGHPALENVQADFQKPFRHPATDFTGRHSGPLEALATDFGTTPVNRRHAECVDCHNPHVSRPDALGRPLDLDASKTTLGVSRVAVLNGAAGSPPGYQFIPGADTLTAPVAEYQLCFKCHSSWTTLPSGKTDLARVLNPANPSYHPVEAAGRNTNIDIRSFVTGWSAGSLTRCGSCHGSDFGDTKGPHGSVYPAILKSSYTASPVERTMTSDELCFSCHSFDVYANPGAPQTLQSASRFNRPGVNKGHAEHVGTHRVPCYSCHVTHGSTTLPYLVATGRNPGLTSFSSGPTGGTCATTCHNSAAYTVNYAR